jgi:hypothetical protein
VPVTVDTVLKRASFILPSEGILKKGDNIYITKELPIDIPRYAAYAVRPFLGYVVQINDQEVILEGVPDGLQTGQYHLFVLDYPHFALPVWGNIVQGESLITNVLAYLPASYPPIGERITMSQFPDGAYIVDVNPHLQTIQISAPAISSGLQQHISCSPFEQSVYLQRWEMNTNPVMVEGAKVFLKEPFQQSLYLVNNSISILGTSFVPTLVPVAKNE